MCIFLPKVHALLECASTVIQYNTMVVGIFFLQTYQREHAKQTYQREEYDCVKPFSPSV